MENAKNPLIEMEKDALITNNPEFAKKYGKENEKIWRQLNSPGFNNYFDFYNTDSKVASDNQIITPDENLLWAR